MGSAVRPRVLRAKVERLDPPSPLARVLTLAALALATLLTFAGTLRNGWVNLDDGDYVFQNPHVVHGWNPADAAWFLAHPHAANWHPLTSWCHQVIVSLLGPGPAAHHAVALALHALTAVLLALVLHRFTRAWWRSVLVAALFALHPLRVESVAWASELKDVLSGLFFVLALEAYRRWAERPGAGRYAVVAVTLALGLMAKPMLVTVPFVLVLLDVWPLGRLGAPGAAPARGAPPRGLSGLVAEKWPLFGLAVASSVVTVQVQRGAGAVTPTAVIPPATRVLNAFASYGWYVLRTLWPSRLAVFYPFPRTPAVLPALAGLVLVAAVTCLVMYQGQRRPYLAVGWFWYVGMLVPVIGLLQVGSQAHADRYSYLPAIGLAVAAVWGVTDLLARAPRARQAAAATAVVALAVLAVASSRQAATWHDSRTLYRHALAVTRDNAFAHAGLGQVHLLAHEVPEALAELREAERIEPTLEGVEKRLGTALGAAGHYEEAIAHFRLALRTQDSASLRGSLGIALAALGRYAEALPELEAGLAREPGNHLIRLQLAEVLIGLGRRDEAMRMGESAVELARQGGDYAAAAAYADELRALAAGDSTRAARR